MAVRISCDLGRSGSISGSDDPLNHREIIVCARVCCALLERADNGAACSDRFARPDIGIAIYCGVYEDQARSWSSLSVAQEALLGAVTLSKLTFREVG
jgi:hypothetical protein